MQIKDNIPIISLFVSLKARLWLSVSDRWSHLSFLSLQQFLLHALFQLHASWNRMFIIPELTSELLYLFSVIRTVWSGTRGQSEITAASLPSVNI